MTVIGVGNPDRGDDAAGLLAARRVRDLRADWHVIERTADILGVFDELGDASGVIMVDAVSCGAPCGEVFRWDVHAETPPECGLRYSTHGFSLISAIELARATGRLPRVAVLYGIQGGCFDAGAPLSPAVRVAVEAIARQIAAEQFTD